MKIKKELKNKQELILKTAQSIFSYFGIKKTTIDEIAKKAGIGKGTVYNYYRSKEELFTAVIKREEEELKALILEEVKKSDNPKIQLETFIFTKVKHIFNLKNFYKIKQDLFEEIYPEVQNIIKGYYKFERNLLTDIFNNGIKKGVFEIGNVKLTVQTIMNILKALEFYWLKNSKYSMDKILQEIKFLTNMFYNGIEKR